MKTATSDNVIETIVNPISLRRQHRGFIPALAHLHIAHDVLEHDDGVVHHETDGQRQRHQRQLVQAVAEQVHRGERADDREDDGGAGNQCGREIPQEEEDDHHDQRDRQHERELDVVESKPRMDSEASNATSS